MSGSHYLKWSFVYVWFLYVLCISESQFLLFCFLSIDLPQTGPGGRVSQTPEALQWAVEASAAVQQPCTGGARERRCGSGHRAVNIRTWHWRSVYSQQTRLRVSIITIYHLKSTEKNQNVNAIYYTFALLKIHHLYSKYKCQIYSM